TIRVTVFYTLRRYVITCVVYSHLYTDTANSTIYPLSLHDALPILTPAATAVVVKFGLIRMITPEEACTSADRTVHSLRLPFRSETIPTITEARTTKIV